MEADQRRQQRDAHKRQRELERQNKEQAIRLHTILALWIESISREFVRESWKGQRCSSKKRKFCKLCKPFIRFFQNFTANFFRLQAKQLRIVHRPLENSCDWICRTPNRKTKTGHPPSVTASRQSAAI